MPRSSFNTGVLGGMSTGLSRLAGSLLTKGQAYQQGYDTENLNQGRIAQMLSQIDQNNAQANKAGAEADHKRYETSILQRRPDQFEEQAALASNTDLPMVRLIRESIAKGQAPQIEMAGPTEDGNPLMGDVDPGKVSAVKQALMRFMPVVTNTGDLKIDDWAKAQGAYRNMDLGDQVLAGSRTAADIGRSQAAVEAKPLYHADPSGAVLDLFSGGLDTNNPMAKSTIALRGEQAGAQRANAAQSYASADSSRATAAKTRAETEAGAKGTYDPTRGVIVDVRGGTARPVLGPDGQPMGAKDKDLTDAQAKANLFGSRMMEADKVIASMAGKYSPAAVNSKVAAGEIPVIGGVAGLVGNKMLSESSQQVEQAQRDFINAVLRRESGAAIAPSEFANAAKQYFPQPGDKPATLAQKARNRKLAVDGLMAEVPAGKRYTSGSSLPGAQGGATGGWDAPAPGAVIDGFRFKGGNPADQGSWEPV